MLNQEKAKLIRSRIFWVFAILFLYMVVLSSFVIYEVLSIAQRSYILTAPRLEPSKKKVLDRSGLKDCSLQRPCPPTPLESFPLTPEKESGDGK